jgi:hypothetical protein
VAAARKLEIRLWILLLDELEYHEFCRRGQKPQKSSECGDARNSRWRESHRPVD